MATVDQIRKLIQSGAAEKAVTLLKSAARRRPKDTALLTLLAEAYTEAGQHTFALSTHDRLAQLVPRAPKPLADKALLLQQLNRMAEANTALHSALALAPLNGSLLRMLSASDRLWPGDPHVVRFVDAWTDGTLPAKERLQAGFALFKAFGAEGFHYLREANQLQRQAHAWSISGLEENVSALKASMSTTPWPAAPGVAHTAHPIFVTGMPRSGTTLVEQILSCHPKVTPTGETGLALRAAYSVLLKGKTFRPVSALSTTELEQISKRYLDAMAHFHGARGVFADKSIQTYLLIGLLSHVMPQAKCVFVRRDPRDIGWSIYRNYFETGTHGYSNDLSDIGAHIRVVDEMVAFWADLSPRSFLEVRYEDLVSDPEPEIRRLLEYCELDWDPACLSPEKNTRTVKTLSIDQVRSPISAASVGGWRRYASELEPLQHALGDLTKPWD